MSFTDSHRSALKLDLNVLESLLARNWQAHGKTLYFRRLQMAVKRIPPLLQLELQPKSDRWDLITNPIPDIVNVIQRLEYASQALFMEAARGYFLPLISVALACVGRLRTLSQKLGLHLLDHYSNSTTTPKEEIVTALLGSSNSDRKRKVKKAEKARNKKNIPKKEASAAPDVKNVAADSDDVGEAVHELLLPPTRVLEEPLVVNQKKKRARVVDEDEHTRVLDMVEEREQQQQSQKSRKKQKKKSKSKEHHKKKDFFDDLFAQT